MVLKLIALYSLTIISNSLLSQDLTYTNTFSSSNKNFRKECWIVDSIKQTDFLKRLNLNNGFLLFKVGLKDSKGSVSKYMVYNHNLQNYLKSKQITNKDSIENYVMDFIIGREEIPIIDSTYLDGVLVNQLKLDKLNSTPMVDILKTYFDEKGIFKDILYDNEFIALSCFMFEHAIIFGYPYGEGTARIDSYYIYKLKEANCWTK